MQSTMNCILLFHGWNFYGGKAYNPCPPGWQKYFDILRDYFNIKENWARPDDPTRARLYVPEQADLNNARLIRWGKTPLKKEEREQAKETLHSYIIQQIEQGKIKNRTDIIQALQDIGLQINRQGKDYITVIEPNSKEKLRLKGAMYAEQFDLTDRKNQSQSRAGTDTAKPGGANSFSYGSKQGFTIDFDPIRRNLAALDHCVQQLKSFTAIFAKTFEKVKDRRIGR